MRSGSTQVDPLAAAGLALQCLFSAESTKKMQMTNIRNIINEPIEGHEEYSILGLQTGTT